MEERFGTPETFSSEQEQQQILEGMNNQIEVFKLNIQRALDLGQINCAIHHAAKMVEILRTSSLTPKNYYTIYHAIQTSLVEIHVTLHDKDRFPDDIVSELYEIVQYFPGCMQRLYLMITVAPELSQRGKVKVNDLLDDISDMAKSAQDPIRALFLRHYLLSIFKQYLPDSTPEETERSLDFLLNNFAQMNRMWVRIEDIMGSDERKSQRKEFSVLIGTNIQRISSLNGLTIQNYSTIILPFLVKHVELCEDALAQDFILRSVIHAFPEDFHIATIDQLFNVFGKVEQGVQILDILNQLLERFLQYIGHLIDAQKSSAVFVTIAKNIEELFNAEGHLGLTDKFETLQRLLKFALKINTNDVKNVRNLMKFTDFHIDLAIGEDVLTNLESSKKLREFLEVPLNIFTSAQFLYKIEYLPILIRRLCVEDRLSVSSIICDLFVNSRTEITDDSELDFFMKCAMPLLQEGKCPSSVFSMVHMVKTPEPANTIKLLLKMMELPDTINFATKERMILPVGHSILGIIISQDGEFASSTGVPMLVKFVDDIREIYPQKALLLYRELIKHRNIAGIKENITSLVSSITHTLTLIEKPTQLYHSVLYTLDVLKDLDMEISGEELRSVFNSADRIAGVVRRANCISLSAILLLRPGCDPISVEARLNDGLGAAITAVEDIGQVLHALYYVLDAAAYVLEAGCPLSDRWVTLLLTEISNRHRDILDRGHKLEMVMPKATKMFYINLAKYIACHDFFPDDEEEEEEKETAENQNQNQSHGEEEEKVE